MAKGHKASVGMRIPKLVWGLAGVGIGAGVLVLGVASLALHRINDQSFRTRATVAKATASFHALRTETAVVTRSLESHFSDDAGPLQRPHPNPQRLMPYVADCRKYLSQIVADC